MKKYYGKKIPKKKSLKNACSIQRLIKFEPLKYCHLVQKDNCNLLLLFPSVVFLFANTMIPIRLNIKHGSIISTY